MSDTAWTKESAIEYLISQGLTPEEFRRAVEIATRAKKEADQSPLRKAAHNVYELLKDQFWTNGGFLQSVGEGRILDEGPDCGKGAVYVFVARKPYHFEEKFIPKEMDGFPVIVKFMGKVVIGSPK